MKGLVGTKVGMTQVFTETGAVVPVTVVEVKPNTIVQKKTLETDGYEALQIGYEEQKESRVNKPKRGQYDKAGVSYRKHLVELHFDGVEEYEVGEDLDVGLFEEGELVDVTGVSKGKGTQGPIKRYNLTLGRMSHGSRSHRTGGARAAAADPGRVFPGSKGSGRMGNERVTVQNLELVRVDSEKGLILVKGALPGKKGSLVTIKSPSKNVK